MDAILERVTSMSSFFISGVYIKKILEQFAQEQTGNM
jgi:hypothetical protein